MDLVAPVLSHKYSNSNDRGIPRSLSEPFDTAEVLIKTKDTQNLAAPTKRTTLSNERAGRILAGVSVLFVLALAMLVSPYFLLIQVFISGNLILSGITNNCQIKSLLLKLGFKTERSLGYEDADSK